jgi:hypothetical protein
MRSEGPLQGGIIILSPAFIITSAKLNLKRYLAEFDFRYNNRMSLGINDGERTAKALKGIEGKRLTYRPTH